MLASRLARTLFHADCRHFICLAEGQTWKFAPGTQVQRVSASEKKRTLDAVIDSKPAQLRSIHTSALYSSVLFLLAGILINAADRFTQTPAALLTDTQILASVCNDIVSAQNDTSALEASQLHNITHIISGIVGLFCGNRIYSEKILVEEVCGLLHSIMGTWHVQREHTCHETGYRRNTGHMDFVMRQPTNKKFGIVLCEAKRKFSISTSQKAMFQLLCYSTYSSIQNELSQSQYALLMTLCNSKLTTHAVNSNDLTDLKKSAYDHHCDPKRKLPFYNLCLTGKYWDLTRARDFLLFCAVIARLECDDGLTLHTD